jgi:hypothetical protein
VQIIGLAVAAVVLLTLFVAREARASEPILPLHLFRNPIFTVAGAITLLLGLALFGAIVYLPEYLQVVRGASAISSGLQLIPLTLGMLGTALFGAVLLNRLQHNLAVLLPSGTGRGAQVSLASHQGAPQQVRALPSPAGARHAPAGGAAAHHRPYRSGPGGRPSS